MTLIACTWIVSKGFVGLGYMSLTRKHQMHLWLKNIVLHLLRFSIFGRMGVIATYLLGHVSDVNASIFDKLRVTATHDLQRYCKMSWSNNHDVPLKQSISCILMHVNIARSAHYKMRKSLARDRLIPLISLDQHMTRESAII